MWADSWLRDSEDSWLRLRDSEGSWLQLRDGEESSIGIAIVAT